MTHKSIPGTNPEPTVPGQHNYITKLLKLQFAGKIQVTPGQVNHLTWNHDDWCGTYSGQLCNCDVELTYGMPARTASRAERRANQKGNK